MARSASQDNRSALATDIYTFKGVGVETWSPRFRGQGFRRVEVTGLPGKVTAEEFAGLVVENNLDPVGSFECSIPLLNQIYRNVRWGERIFLRNGVPLDPDRDERQPWVGDPAKDSEGEAFNFNVAAFYDKWINDNFLDQQPDGQQSDVSPAYWAFYSGDIRLAQRSDHHSGLVLLVLWRPAHSGSELRAHEEVGGVSAPAN